MGGILGVGVDPVDLSLFLFLAAKTTPSNFVALINDDDVVDCSIVSTAFWIRFFYQSNRNLFSLL